MYVNCALIYALLKTCVINFCIKKMHNYYMNALLNTCCDLTNKSF